MKYVKQEYLYGLPVYHYETYYDGVVIDQTENLTYLPGVPETKGVSLKPHLELWIEPVSGIMVKYRDDTLASYYDRKTRELLTPWNHFSNTFTEESVKKTVKLAKNEKTRLIAYNRVIPAFLFLLSFLFFFSSNFAKFFLKLAFFMETIYGAKEN